MPASKRPLAEGARRGRLAFVCNVGGVALAFDGAFGENAFARYYRWGCLRDLKINLYFTVRILYFSAIVFDRCGESNGYKKTAEPSFSAVPGKEGWME